MSERVTNSFNGGMSNDIDEKLRPNETYIDSINGRLVFNEDGSLSWECVNGNVAAISGLPSQGYLIGNASFNDFCVVMIKTNNADEIGVIKFDKDGYGVYSQLLSDISDVDKFNWDRRFPIQAKPFYEEDELIRVYYVDDLNEPRVITFKEENGTFTTVTTTVHRSAINPDWQMGDIWIYEQERKGGCLESAMYQYTFRLVMDDGYKTPWFPLTRHIMVFPNQGVNGWDNNMSDIGKKTPKANTLKLEGLDTRYDGIEIAYVKSIAAQSPIEARIFHDGELKGASMTIKHGDNAGQAITLESIIDKLEFVSKAKTIATKDNRLWMGNIETNPITDIPDSVFANLDLKPIFRSCTDDMGAAYATYDDGVMLRNKWETSPRSSQYEKTNGTHADRTRRAYWTGYYDPIYEHAYTGYFRSEIYRFGIVFFDKKGNDMFVKHLADMRFPAQSENAGWLGGLDGSWWEWRRIKNDGSFQGSQGKFNGIMTASATCNFLGSQIQGETDNFDIVPTAWCPTDWIGTLDEITNVKYRGNVSTSYATKTFLKYMGLEVSGINLNVVVNGKPLHEWVSGFKIVRVPHTDESRIVKRQGLFQNLFQEYVADLEASKDITVNPHPSYNNLMSISSDTGNPQVPYSGYYDGEGKNKNAFDSKDPEALQVLGGHGVFLCPDILYEDADPEQEPGSELWTVNFAWSTSYSGGKSGGFATGAPFNSSIINGMTATQLLNHINSGVPNIYSNEASTTQYRGIPWGASLNGGRDFHHYVQKAYNTRQKAVMSTDRKINNNQTTLSLRSGISIGGAPNAYKWEYIYRHDGGVDAFDLPSGQTFNPITHIHGKWGGSWNQFGFAPAPPSDDDRIFDREMDGGEPGKGWLQAVLAKNVSIIKMPTTALGAVLAFGSGYDGIIGAGWHTINWIVPRSFSATFGGQTLEALQTNVFETTGHFQRVDSSTIAASGGQFDDIHIWGGDCYLQMHGQSYLSPLIDMDEKTCDFVSESIFGKKRKYNGKNVRIFRDYSLGICFPVESKYNLAVANNDPLKLPSFGRVGHSTGAFKSFNDADYAPQRNYRHERGIYIGGRFPDKKKDPITQICERREGRYIINSIVLHKEGLRFYFPKPADFRPNNDFPSRWVWSNEKKPYGEVVDRFRQFEELASFDLNATYGEITGSAPLFDNIYSVQERAFGRLRAGDRAMINANDGQALVLGDAGVMDGIDYISKEFGSQHRDTIVNSNNHLYFLDARMGRVFSFGQEGLQAISDTKGLHSFFQPFLDGLEVQQTRYLYQGAHAGFDWLNNEYVLTINSSGAENYDTYNISRPPGGSSSLRTKTESYSNSKTDREQLTIAFSEDLKVWTSQYSIAPYMYFSVGNHFYSYKDRGQIHLHNVPENKVAEWYGNVFKSLLKFSVNKYPSVGKMFDNEVMNVNDDMSKLLNKVSYISDTDPSLSALINVSSENETESGYLANGRRVEYKVGLLRMPIRDTNKSGTEGKRVSGKSMTVEMLINNDSVLKPSITSTDTIIRTIHRI